MQYRIDRLNNIYIRLNDDGIITMIKIWKVYDQYRITKTESNVVSDWMLIYNNYSHSNKREFDEAESKSRI